MENKLIIGLIGRPGSGKDTVVEIMKEVAGARVEKFSFSQILIDEYCAHLGITPTHPNLQYIGAAIRPSWLHRRAQKYIKSSKADIIVIPSIRRSEDFAFIQSFPNHKLIGIVTDEKRAFERMKKRKEKLGEEHLTWYAYQALRNGAIEQEVGTLLEKAEIKITNNEGREELCAQVKAIFENE